MIKTFIKKLNIVILLVGFILYSSSLPTLLFAANPQNPPIPGDIPSTGWNPGTDLLPPLDGEQPSQNMFEGNEGLPAPTTENGAEDQPEGEYTLGEPFGEIVDPFTIANGEPDPFAKDYVGTPAEDREYFPIEIEEGDIPNTSEGLLEPVVDDAIRSVNRATGGSNRPSQAQAYVSGSSTAAQTGGPVKSAASCFAGTLLSNLLTSTITTAINSIVGATEAVIGTAIGLLSVPVADWNVKLDTIRTKEQLQFQSAARVGTTLGGAGINALVNVSWDAVGYCIVNSMIDYIARSTIAWAKSGFQGNPSFVDNPGQFFKQLGDLEAGAFLQQIAYGVVGQNICQPFRAQIVLTIARDYLGTGYYGSDGYANGGYGGGAGNRTFGGCSLSNIKGDLKAFLGGDFRRGGWDSWLRISQIDTNNPYSTYLNLSAQMYGRTQKKKDLANLELSWGKGFLSFRKCDSKTAEKDKSKCPITTPGNLIEDQLSKTLNISKERLVLAEKFDQVIAVIVNELINTALNKVLN